MAMVMLKVKIHEIVRNFGPWGLNGPESTIQLTSTQEAI